MEIFPAAGSAVDAGNPAPVDANPNPAGDPAPAETTSWRDSLPEDLKAEKSLESFKDVNSLAKSYVHAAAKIGAKGLIIPADDAPQEEKDAFAAALGRPETPDGYEFAYPEGYPDELKAEEDVTAFKGKAHELGLSSKQLAGIMDWYNESVMGKHKGMVEGMAAAKETAETALRTEWGSKYEENCQVVLTAYKQFADPEFVQHLEATGLGNDPHMARVFFNIGKAMGEDSTLKGGENLNVGGSFEAQRATLMAHPAFRDPGHAQYQGVQNKLKELYDKQYPADKA